MRSFSSFIVVLSLGETVSGCVPDPDKGARDAAGDRAADSITDRIVDDRFDASPDHPTDLAIDEALDGLPDQMPDARAERLSDLSLPDVAADAPPDSGGDAPPDSPFDTSSTGACVGPVAVDSLSDTGVPISAEDAVAYGCNPQYTDFRPMMRAFRLTKPRRLLMYHRHNLQIPPETRFGVTRGCTSKSPLIASGGIRCMHVIVDLTPGDYGIVECFPFEPFVYWFEDAASPASNVNCAGSVNLSALAAGHPEPRIVDNQPRYYTFSVPMVGGQPTTRAVAFTFTDKQGEGVRVTVRRVCADASSDVDPSVYVRLCIGSDWTQGRLDLAPGSYTAIVSDIPVGTKYTLRVGIAP
jgi:hypothetical protein